MISVSTLDLYIFGFRSSYRFQVSAVNYVAISEALETSSSVVTAGLAADNLICAVYFTTLFALASKIPAEATLSATVSGCIAPG
ncbi:hypothetical protein K7X08_003964 [Anisodus acutangulus]|uniref:Uncharacterized protein n=1 Tax=Anisodus acutangulus TaxID=402998 RepID=A0A9Q1RK62_9SOLA|nr:hypothetical protein K7X08_003964 [Anisodus acutangulus]